MSRKDESINAGLDAYHNATGAAPDAAVEQALTELADYLMEEDDDQ